MFGLKGGKTGVSLLRSHLEGHKGVSAGAWTPPKCADTENTRERNERNGRIMAKLIGPRQA